MDFATDIPADLAARAHANTSHTPELRGRQEIASYESTLTADLAALRALANTVEKAELLNAEFARYRAGYRRRYLDRLGALSRCASAMVTGPANFPAERNRKANASADKATKELGEYRERALAAIRKRLCPELRPVMGGDADALERLAVKLARLESAHAMMVAANKKIREKRGGTDAQVAALADLGFSELQARELLAPDAMGRVGFPPFAIANSSAELNRLRRRITELTTAKAVEDETYEGPLARLVISRRDDRVRVFFPGKPAEEVRDALKVHSFRWSSAGKCWQAYLNPGSLAFAAVASGAVLNT
jgi:hypothetical protein